LSNLRQWLDTRQATNGISSLPSISRWLSPMILSGQRKSFAYPEKTLSNRKDWLLTPKETSTSVVKPVPKSMEWFTNTTVYDNVSLFTHQFMLLHEPVASAGSETTSNIDR